MTDLTIRDLERSDLNALLSLYEYLQPQDSDGVLVCACNAAVIPNLTRGARPYALIENVVTHPNYRRHGIASKVLGELVQRCLARRCYKVMLMSARHRADVYPFYESLGFDKDAKQGFVIGAR